MTNVVTASHTDKTNPVADYGQTVLVLQGGGALGAYQAGVYQALHEAGIEPDWIIGTSIGAINASLIAGNKPEDRLTRLKQFWSRVEYNPLLKFAGAIPIFGQATANALATAGGIEGFFEPNPRAYLGNHVKLGAEEAGYYSTAPLQRTLSELVDFNQVNSGPTRLTVGAANVQTSAMRYFDSRDEKLNVKHVMASGALPPAFPAIRIDGELYWDGGILSNTPVEAVFDDKPRRNSLVFAVHLWNPNGPEPDSILKVANRQKDLQYSSRAGTHIARQRQIHRLRHIIAELAARLPKEELESNFVRDIAAFGCLTRMHVVRLLAPQVRGEDHAKDIDFSPSGIQTRWKAGYGDTRRVLGAEPWKAPVDPIEGFVLHEANAGVMQQTPAPSTTIPNP
jgi:NTE family protein